MWAAIFQNRVRIIFLEACAHMFLFTYHFLCVSACIELVFVCVCATPAVIGLRPGHEMFSSSCAKRADLLHNLLGTCQQ